MNENTKKLLALAKELANRTGKSTEEVLAEHLGDFVIADDWTEGDDDKPPKLPFAPPGAGHGTTWAEPYGQETTQ